MKDENRFEMLPVKGSFGKATVLIGRRTGVNYLSVLRGGVTPLYNADGSLVVTVPHGEAQRR